MPRKPLMRAPTSSCARASFVALRDFIDRQLRLPGEALDGALVMGSVAH
jgi:hypothetical protein